MTNFQAHTVRIHSYYLNFHFQILIAMLIPILTLPLIMKKYMNSTFAISASTSVSVCKRFPAKTFHSQASKCSPQQPRQIVTNKITIYAWPTHYSKAYNLFHLLSFNENCCKFPKISLDFLYQRIPHQEFIVV